MPNSINQKPTANTANRLGVAYIFAISTIGVLAIGSFLSLRALVEEQKKNTVLVNIAGRQRRLSQTIAIDCLKLATPSFRQDEHEIREHLDSQLKLFRSSHAMLLKRSGELLNTRAPSAGEHDIYFDKLHLNDAVNQFCDHVTNILTNSGKTVTPDDPDTKYIMDVAETDLLSKLDKAVTQCDLDSQESVAHLEEIESRLLIATLVLLLLEALFIFRPMANRVRSQMQSLIDTQKELNAIFDNVGDALFTMDKNYTIRTANAQAATLWGIPQSELIGLNFKQLIDLGRNG